MLAVDFLVVHPHVLFLDKSGIRQHDCTQIARSVRTIYIPAESFLIYIRNQTGVVYMGVREQNEVDLRGVYGDLLIDEHVFSLLHAAIDEIVLPGDLQKRAAAGDFMRCSQKSNFQ